MVVRGSPECFCLRPSRADMARNAAMINNKASIISLEMSFCVGYKCDFDIIIGVFILADLKFRIRRKGVSR